MHQSSISKQCLVEKWNLMNPTRQRAESSQFKNQEDHIAGKGFISMSHYNLVHKFIPMPQAMKNTRCERKPQREKKEVSHLKNAESEPKSYRKYKGRVVLRGDFVKDDSGASAVFTEQGSSASQMTSCKNNGRYRKITRL